MFSAAGTAGQRCTTLRRLIVHSSVADALVQRIVAAYRTLPIGDPAAEGTLVGPLIHETAYRDMVGALEQARADGGEVIGGERHDIGGEGPPRPSTSHRRWCGCPRRPTSCTPRRSRRSSTC